MSDLHETPEFTPEHKVNTLLIQRDILTLQLRLDNLRSALDTYAQKIMKDLGVDQGKYICDLDRLGIVPKE